MFKYKFNKRSAVHLLIILLIVSGTSCQEILRDNEIDGNINHELNELTGGEFVGERTLGLSQSPYLLTNDWEIELGAKLIIEPGVTIHFAPMVGITVRGSIIAIVSIFNLIKNQYFKRFFSHKFNEWAF